MNKEKLSQITDQKELAEFFKNDTQDNASLNEEYNRAVEKIKDKELLLDIALNAKNFYVREKAVEIITDQNDLINIAKNVANDSLGAKAVWKITNPDGLNDVAKNAKTNIARINAIEKITDTGVLTYISKNDEGGFVRGAAKTRLIELGEIPDKVSLEQLAVNDVQPVRLMAVANITDENVLFSIAYKDKDEHVRSEAIKRITDQKKLIKYVKDCPHGFYYAARTALEKIKDESVMRKIALKHKEESARRAAVEFISDQKTLISIAKKDSDTFVRSDAAQKITDQNVLYELSRTGPKYAREMAIQTLTDKAILKKIVNSGDEYLITVTESASAERPFEHEMTYDLRDTAKKRLAKL